MSFELRGIDKLNDQERMDCLLYTSDAADDLTTV